MTAKSLSGRWPDLRQLPLLRPLFLLILWMALWRLASILEYAPHASIWFPPAGLTFAALLLLGINALPWILTAAMLVTFWETQLYAVPYHLAEQLSTGVLFGLVHSLSYYLGAAFMRRRLDRAEQQQVPELVLLFLMVASLCALLAAMGGATVLLISGTINSTQFLNVWVPWWIGDLIGVIVLVPLFVALLQWLYPNSASWLQQFNLQRYSRDNRPYLVKLFSGLLLLALTMLANVQISNEYMAFVVFFVALPQMWIVYTETALRSTVSLALISTLAAMGIKVFGISHHAMVYEFAVCVLAASTYFGLTVPQLTAHNNTLQQQANFDPLTGVLSRSYFFTKAKEEIIRARHYRQPASMVVFDIDYFKHINDTYGHTTGDRALQQVASSISQQLRQTDLFGRFGGDEFMLLLPGDDIHQATATAQRLCQQLPHKPLDNTDYRISGSFGVVTVQDKEDLPGAFKRADALLLKAKRQGRNCVLSETKPGNAAPA